MKQFVQDGFSAWQGPYGVELETEFGMTDRGKYLAILRYGSERISPLFELDPTISYHSRRYNADRKKILRNYYLRQTLLFLPAAIAIYFLAQIITTRLIRILPNKAA